MAGKKNAIAPNDKRAVEAMDKRQIDRKTADAFYGDGLPFDPVRVETKITASNSGAIEQMTEAGRNYLWYKAYCPHGDFMAMVGRTSPSHTYVLNCMRFADYFSNSAPVPNLGTRKAKALTLLDKPVVEKYLEGGPLGDIPHDDVADMSVRELEEEIRKLRQKIEKTEKVARERIRQKDEQITKLEFENENRVSPTQEQIAQTALTGMTGEYSIAIAQVNGAIREAYALVAKAEKIEGVNVQQLSEWLGQFSPDIQTFHDVTRTWMDEIDNAEPIKDWRISDLPGGEAQA